MERNYKLNEPLRHKIASQVINEMNKSIISIKNSTFNDLTLSCNSYSKNSSSFDMDFNLEGNNDSLSRFSAEEMDEQRQQNIAYEYLCHLEEAKKWIETCIREELPNTTECEENLRNGVYLAKLSNFFCPEKVPFKKIFDKDQSRYQMFGLQFRHTDNINHWFKAMEHIGLPKIFFPETTDIYDRKNMPRVIYCLHALSLYLYKLGIATQIQNLYGVAKFTEEEITTMAFELAKQGLNIPEFTQIGGILANEMPIDEAALHAAILAINDVIEKKNLEMLLKYLQLYDAHLVNVVTGYINFYHELMYEEKLKKFHNSIEKSNETNYAFNVYDELLTQNEIQNIINKINVEKLSTEISESINKQDVNLLLNLLTSKRSPFKNVSEKNINWYMAQLTKEKETKLSDKKVLDTETIQIAINISNSNADKSDKGLKLLDRLNGCLINNNRDEFILNLSHHINYFQSEEIDADYAGNLFFVEFKYIYDEKENPLGIDDYKHGIKVLNVVIDINKVIDNAASNIESNKSECLLYDSNLLLSKIKHPNANLREMIIESLRLKYLHSFVSAKQFKNNNSNNSSTINMYDSKNNISLSDSGHAESEILQCHLLTHSEIQECIIIINTEFKNECHILQVLNENDFCIDKLVQVIGLIKSSYNEKLNIIDLNTYLYLIELKKQKKMKATLEIKDLKSIINSCNTILENALNMTKTMLLLNQIDELKKEEILNLLKNKSLGINLRLESNCKDLYYQTFRDLKRICQKPASICSITNSHEYFWNKTIEEYDFYLNLKNPSIYSWTMPVNFIEATHLITRSILKKAIDAINDKYELNLLYLSKETLVVKLQSLARGFLCRLAIEKRAEYLINHTKDVIKLQAWWRMVREKRLYKNRLSHLKINLRSIILLQSIIRMWICRKNFVKQREHMKQFEKNIVKIQAHIRARNARVDYQSLMNDKIPSLRVVSKFVHLLEHNNTDYTEEIELQELKRKIMNLIKANKHLEHDLDMMDVKIGLLIKNRITLQDVLIQHKRLRKYKEDIENNQTNHIRQLSRENHEKIEMYQNLFYLLQTQPNYLATLLFQLPTSNSSKFIETVVLQLFNYGANSREEYLLLKLFTASLELEIENTSKLDKISDIITGTPLVIKVIVSLYRKHRGENILRNLLSPIVNEFLADKDVDLCLNPIELYKNWINKLESDTGKPSGLSYDVTNKQALSHVEIRNRLTENIKMVKMYTAKFLHLILKSIAKVPFGLRYISKILKNKLKSKFPKSTDREILKIIGNLVYYRFINSAVCSPDMYDVIDTKVGTSLNSNERKNLACISKHLNLIAMSKGYGDCENSHLACLNPFIKESHELMRTYFQDICNVPEADEFFGINEYSDLIILTKPIVYMTIQEISDSHKLLAENLDKIAPDSQDPLRKIFSLLKHEPDFESFNMNRPISVVSLQKANNDCSNTINKNTQLCLTLTNRFTPQNEDKSDLNSLLIRTKRLIIEIIHCQHGETIEKIIKTTANKEQETFHEYIVKKRAENTKLLSPDYQKIANNLSVSLETMKEELLLCVKDLKKIKKINKDNEIFEEIIRQIAQDIRNQRKHRQRRQKELIHLHEVHNVLNKKSDLLTEQVTYYNEYVKACLDSLNSKKSIGSRTRNPFKRMQSEKVQGSVKYSASKLYDKGVILEIKELQPKQFKNVIFGISTTQEPGLFDVNVKVLGKTVENFELVFQDLLQMQYDGASIMNISGFAKINVNLLIFLLNKKFYGK